MKKYIFIVLVTFSILTANNVYSAEEKPKNPSIWETIGNYDSLSTRDIFSPRKATGDTTEGNEDKLDTIPELIGHVIDLALIAISTVALVFMVIGGIAMIFSGANEDLFSKGKNAVTYSLVGIVVAFLSFIIIRFIDVIFR